MYTFICICVCMCICVYVYMYMYLFVRMHIRLYVPYIICTCSVPRTPKHPALTNISNVIDIYIYIYKYIYIYIYIYICMNVFHFDDFHLLYPAYPKASWNYSISNTIQHSEFSSTQSVVISINKKTHST